MTKAFQGARVCKIGIAISLKDYASFLRCQEAPQVASEVIVAFVQYAAYTVDGNDIDTNI